MKTESISISFTYIKAESWEAIAILPVLRRNLKNQSPSPVLEEEEEESEEGLVWLILFYITPL